MLCSPMSMPKAAKFCVTTWIGQHVDNSPSAVNGSFVPIGKPCNLISLKYNHQAGSAAFGTLLSDILRDTCDVDT